MTKEIKPGSVDETAEMLTKAGYVTDRSLAVVVHLALHLEKPLFVEGPPGVGKTELALGLAKARNRELIRLQCYEGLDRAAALYEWNYPKQILRIKLEEAACRSGAELEPVIFSRDYLLERPLVQALTVRPAPVLLIDELDRADEEFEAFLLEMLADFQVTIPELGTIKAEERPTVVITSNRTREIHDALKRRCLFHWLDYPDRAKELAVIRSRLPGVDQRLAEQATDFLQSFRRTDLTKKPGLSESLDWVQALLTLEADRLTPELIEATTACLLKYREDEEFFKGQIWGDPARRAALLKGCGRG